MKVESGATRSIIDEVHSSDVQGDQIEDESGVTRNILMNLILRISNKVKWKVKTVLLQVSWTNFFLRIPN